MGREEQIPREYDFIAFRCGVEGNISKNHYGIFMMLVFSKLHLHLNILWGFYVIIFHNVLRYYVMLCNVEGFYLSSRFCENIVFFLCYALFYFCWRTPKCHKVFFCILHELFCTSFEVFYTGIFLFSAIDRALSNNKKKWRRVPGLHLYTKK